MRALQFQLFADYFQFYLQDEPAKGDLSKSWSKEATARMLAVAPGTVGIGTTQNTHVAVLLEVHDEEPPIDLAEWDHVAECSLDVGSGRIVIAGCTDYFPDADRLEVPPGHYRARVSFGVLTRGSDGGLPGEDHYRVQLWLNSAIAPRTLKQRPV
jgi:hypothetical protein